MRDGETQTHRFKSPKEVSVVVEGEKRRYNMCQFFSLVSDGKGNPMYFDWKLRKKCLDKELNYEPDSHTSIADYFGRKGAKEDTLNKYEYNPILKTFQTDQLNTTDDSKKIQKFCEKLDFKKIIPQLNIHPIVHPFKDLSTTKVTKQDLVLLKKWASVRTSVWTSVGDSIWDSVGASVRDSVGDSIRGYISSYFLLDNWKHIKHKKGKNPFQPAIDLWNRGLVPSFDGKVWRLHGKEGKVVWEGVPK